VDPLVTHVVCTHTLVVDQLTVLYVLIIPSLILLVYSVILLAVIMVMVLTLIPLTITSVDLVLILTITTIHALLVLLVRLPTPLKPDSLVVCVLQVRLLMELAQPIVHFVLWELLNTQQVLPCVSPVALVIILIV